jgi:segregation and condensation protein A
MDRPETENQSHFVKIDNFEGPFDLLLYLVRNAKINVHELSLSNITAQYIETIREGRINLDAASEFIFVASYLIYLKSRALIPQEVSLGDDEPDERREFIDNLIEYQKYKNVSHVLREGIEADNILIRQDPQLIIDFKDSENWEEVSIVDLILAFARVAREVDRSAFKSIEMEEISIEDKIDEILNNLINESQLMFDALFPSIFSKYELIITFLALLELVKMKKIFILQHKLFGSIKILKREGS